MTHKEALPVMLLMIKKGFRAVIQSKEDSFRATIFDSSIPRCSRLLSVPVVFDSSCSIHDLRERDPQWLRSHVQLLPFNNAQVLFIGKVGLYGGGHNCSKCATYYCHRCHYSCPNAECYDYCTHRWNHNCVSRQDEQQRAQEVREKRRRRAQEERDHQERIRQEQIEQEVEDEIMSTLPNGLQETSVIEDDEIDYTSEEEFGKSDDCSINAPVSHYGNLLSRGSPLPFESQSTSTVWIDKNFTKRPISKSWYKHIEMYIYLFFVLLKWVLVAGWSATRWIGRHYTKCGWIEKILMVELLCPKRNFDRVFIEIFEKYWYGLRRSLSSWDRLKVLYSLRKKQLAHRLSYSQINDIFVMIVSLQTEGLRIICQEEASWYQKLKRCWIERKLVRKNCGETIFEGMVDVLVNLPWTTLMIRQFLRATVGVKNHLSVLNLLCQIENENVAHPVVMNMITQIQDKMDSATAWTQELFIRKIYELSPQIACDIHAKLGHHLRNQTINVIDTLIDTNRNLLLSNMSKFATILEHLVTYCTTPSIWVQCCDIIKEENPENWITKIDTTIISSIFGKSHECNLDELTERITCSFMDKVDFKDKFHLVKQAYSADKLHPSLYRNIQGPISLWTGEIIRSWARTVKFKPEEISLFEKIAVTCRAVELCHGFSPRATQILSLVMLATSRKLDGRGRLAQINTGEGKSIIVAMLAVIHALRGMKVDVVTTSTELSIREAKKQQRFFEMFDLTVGENSPNREKKAVYRCDIVYGTVSDFLGDILRSEILGNDCRSNRKFQAVIVDEVDSMLFDGRNHSVRLSDVNPGMTHLELPLAVIWQHIHSINSYMVSNDGKVYFDSEGFETVAKLNKLYHREDWEAAKIEVDDKDQFILKHTKEYLGKLLRKSELDEYFQCHGIRLQVKSTQMWKELIDPTIDIPNHLRNFALNQITVWVQNAILAKWTYKRDRHYTVVDGKIVPIDFSETGDLQYNVVWSDGLTQFLQMKEGLKMDPESISTNFISNVSFFQRYGSEIYGLTGTLGEESTQEFLRKTYGTDMVVIPPYKSTNIASNNNSAYRCKELAPLVLSQLGQWYQCVKSNAVYHATNGRGVLIICKYICQVRHFSHMLNKIYDPKKIFIYTGEKTSFEKDTISSGEIIVATNIAGRGTDFKTTEDVERNGGICVLITFLPENFRVEMQNVGRTARDGKRGMAQLIVHDVENRSMERLKKIRHLHETLESHVTIGEAITMVVKDSLFNRFCVLKDEILLDPFERKAIEERWSFWLISKHLDDYLILTEEDAIKYRTVFEQDLEQRANVISIEEATTMFTDEFEQDLRQRAKEGKLIQNPFIYVLKGNEKLEANKLDEAVVFYNRAIELDPVFSVNARYNKALALLSHYENRGYKQKEALEQLRKANNLIETIYRPNLLMCNTLIGQRQHVQHRLDFLSKQELYIGLASQTLKSAIRSNNNVRLMLTNWDEVFSGAKEKYEKVTHDAHCEGLTCLFNVGELVPKSWVSIGAVGLLGFGPKVTGVAEACLPYIILGSIGLLYVATAATKGMVSYGFLFGTIGMGIAMLIGIGIAMVITYIAYKGVKALLRNAITGSGTSKQAGKGLASTSKDFPSTCYPIGTENGQVGDSLMVLKSGPLHSRSHLGYSLASNKMVKKIFHPSKKYPVRDFSPSVPYLQVTTSGDEAVVHVNPMLYESFKINYECNHHKKRVKKTKTRSREAEGMKENAQPEQTAPHRDGGARKRSSKNSNVGDFNENSKDYQELKRILGHELEPDSETMNKAEREHYQVHHVIHRKLKHHPAITQSGFDIESYINKIKCPKTVDIRQALETTRSVHCGRHPNTLVDELEKQLDEAFRDNKDDTIELFKAVLRIVIKERKRLRSGITELQKKKQ